MTLFHNLPKIYYIAYQKYLSGRTRIVNSKNILVNVRELSIQNLELCSYNQC